MRTPASRVTGGDLRTIPEQAGWHHVRRDEILIGLAPSDDVDPCAIHEDSRRSWQQVELRAKNLGVTANVEDAQDVPAPGVRQEPTLADEVERAGRPCDVGEQCRFAMTARRMDDLVV